MDFCLLRAEKEPVPMLPADIATALQGMNALVTGGSGMIGREVVRLLCDCGATVTSVSLDRLEIDPRAEQVYGDLSDFRLCRDLAAGRDAVFHVAGVKGSIEVTKSKPASFLVPLLMMNTNVLEAARRCAVPKVVYTSSIGAYSSAEIFVEDEYDPARPPMDMFPGWAKRMAEMQVDAYRIQYGLANFAIVRPCNVYGPGDNFDPENAMVVPSMMARVRAGERPLVVWGDGSAVRDFAYSADVAEGVILACVKGTGGGFVNLGSGTGVTIRMLVETLAELLGFDYRFDPERGNGFPRRVMDITRARELLGYNPTTSLRDGLEKTWAWFDGHADEYLRRRNYFRE